MERWPGQRIFTDYVQLRTYCVSEMVQSFSAYKTAGVLRSLPSALLMMVSLYSCHLSLGLGTDIQKFQEGIDQSDMVLCKWHSLD